MTVSPHDLQRKLRSVLLDAIEKKELSGANLLVVKGGKELCYLEEGCADLAAGKSIRRDTIFRLYSMTKPVTAVAAMILVEKGQLCLQTPVGEYLPSFRAMQTNRPITVFDLLHMTSGLTYGDGESETEKQTKILLDRAEDSLDTASPITTQAFAEYAGQIPPLFEPGSAWKYGISADIMGAVIEKVSGQSFGAFLREEIFQPLNMPDTGFYVPSSKQERLAKPYEHGEDGELREYRSSFLGIRNRMDKQARFESGGAGLVSTIDDYAKFAGMLLQKGCAGANRILQPQTVEYLTRGQLTHEQQPCFDRWFGQSGFSYGNYLRVLWNPSQAATLGRPMEYCWDGWLGCYFVNCPQESLTFLVMQQKKDAGSLVAKLRNVLFAHDL